MKNYILAAEFEAINSSAMTGSYIPINDAGLPAPCPIINIINASSVAVTISYDGITNHDYLPANSQRNLQFENNAGPQGYACYMRKGTVIYAKSAAGTGIVALSAYYQEA